VNKELLKPQNAPEPIVKYLITNLKLNVSWAYNLKSIIRANQEQGVWDFRLYNEADVRAKNIKIKDFASFDNYPGMVLFEGTYNPKTADVRIKQR